MLHRLLVAVEVVAFLAGAALAVIVEEFFQQFEMIGLGAEMAEVALLLRRPRHLRLHGDAIIAMEAIALDHGGADAIAIENVLEGALDGRGSRAGRAGDGDDWVFLGHEALPVLLFVFGLWADCPRVASDVKVFDMIG